MSATETPDPLAEAETLCLQLEKCLVGGAYWPTTRKEVEDSIALLRSLAARVREVEGELEALRR